MLLQFFMVDFNVFFKNVFNNVAEKSRGTAVSHFPNELELLRIYINI